MKPKIRKEAIMNETLLAMEAFGKVLGGSFAGAVLSLLFLAAWAKRKGILDIFTEQRKSMECPDPACKANMIHSLNRQTDLENHVYKVLSPKVNEIAEGVAFIRGQMEGP